MRAFEMRGVIDEKQQLHLDRSVPVSGPSRVKVIVLVPEDAEELDEAEWLQAAGRNPDFLFLHEDAEDIYSLDDGSPFHNEK